MLRAIKRGVWKSKTSIISERVIMNAMKIKSRPRVVAGLFKQAKAAEPDKQPPIFTKIKAELDVHAHIEETIFTQS